MVAAAGVAGRGGEHEPSGGLSDLEMKDHEHAGIGVRGEHDRAVAQLFLDSLQVCPGSMGQRRGTVPEIVQTYRGRPDWRTRYRNRRVR